MNLRELTNFIRIVEAGSMSKAAAALNLAQTALGLQVRNLELEFKHMLVRRHSRGVHPTEAGRIVLAHARNIMRELEQARTELAQLEEPSGRVTLGMTTSANRIFLAELYLRCRRELPNIMLDVIEAPSSRLIHMMLSGEVQVACLYVSVDAPDLSMELAATDRWVLVVSATDDSAPRELKFKNIANFPLILPSGPSGMRKRLTDEAKALGIELDVVLEVQSETLVRQLVEQGVGATVLPFNAARDAVEAGQLRACAIVDPVFPSHMYVARPAKRETSPSARAVSALLLNISKEKFG